MNLIMGKFAYSISAPAKCIECWSNLVSDKELKSLVKLFYNLAALSPQHDSIDKSTL